MRVTRNPYSSSRKYSRIDFRVPLVQQCDPIPTELFKIIICDYCEVK